MRLLLFILGIGVGIVGIGNRADAQNYPWCATVTAETAAAQIAGSQHSNNAWKPREASAACANRIRNTCLHPDRIR